MCDDMFDDAVRDCGLAWPADGTFHIERMSV